MTLTASREDAEDSDARIEPAPFTSPTQDAWNPHRHTMMCWWDHRECRWVCRRPGVNPPAPSSAPEESVTTEDRSGH
jgi:hypothetical protein